MSRVLLLGSYNGQDSLGDKCLLRCVKRQLERALGGRAEFLAQIHDNLEASRDEFPEMAFSYGLSRPFWLWYNKLRHLRLPFAFHMALAALTAPMFFLIDRQARQARREIGSCQLLYFYGGTQLTRQWFWLNFPPLLLALLLCRVRGIPVFWGPQQYGPQSLWQRRWTRWTVRFLVAGARTRHQACLPVAGLSADALLFDEVFSCRWRYPVISEGGGPAEFILFNLRGENFLRETTQAEFRSFLKLAAALQRKTGLKAKFFQMSGPSFCDDTLLLEHLEQEKSKLDWELLPPPASGRDLIELAKGALGAVSMSFHGAILTMIGGRPAVPVTSGGYYDYKYADFDKYSGGQGMPLLRLDGDPEEAAGKVLAYFERYRPGPTGAAREAACGAIERWYRGIGARLKRDRPLPQTEP